MKKTLIALAALAAGSASFAQISITGSIITGYKASSVSAAAGSGLALLKNGALASVADTFVGGSGGNPTGDASGLGVDTSTLTFAASEDLGGGMKVDASMNFDTVTRKEVVGGDTSLKLTTGIGRFTLQTYKPVDYLSGGISGVGGAGLDDRVFSARTSKDSAGFDTKFGPVVLSYAHFEAGPSKKSPTNLLGLGVGAAGDASAGGQRINSYALTYLGGELVANLNYLQYDGRGDTDSTYKDVIRTSASYNAGFAKFGAGYSRTTTLGGATVTDSLVAASVPAGNWTFGANYGIGNVEGSTIAFNAVAAAKNAATASALGIQATDLDGSRNGYSLTAAYALSKRTSVTASYVNWLSSPFAANRNTEATLFLAHSF
ncbi:porin [Rhodoferax bucti]|uniref:porin n=1 Tax=Rhodoferax bucti TaxID=2576305 RepID=UPI0011086F8B|nr:porin [Rhodoferax bucti]